MVLFPNCKINLGLRVIGKRPDGYHNIDSVFFPVTLKDAAEINFAGLPKKQPHPFELVVSGLPVPGDMENNLCYKAWQLIQNDFPDLPDLKMHLLKAIPTGAGLGGGSSDGAFTLIMLNELLHLELTQDHLLTHAAKLGSDCPFFILNKPCHATGRGEVLEPLALNLEGYHFVVADPGIHIQTAAAFTKIRIDAKADSVKEIVKQPVASWKGLLINDFEKPVFEEFPQIKKIKDDLYNAGAIYASLTGSGSAVYGIFDKRKSVSFTTDKAYKMYHADAYL